MNARRTAQLLILLAAIFGVSAFLCQCASKPHHFSNGTTFEQWMDDQPTEFPKLSEP